MLNDITKLIEELKESGLNPEQTAICDKILTKIALLKTHESLSWPQPHVTPGWPQPQPHVSPGGYALPH